MRLLCEADVAQLVSPDLAIAAAEEAFCLQASGRLTNPGRIDIKSTSDFRGLVLAGLVDGPNFGLKANLHAYPQDAARSTASFLTIWNTETCSPRAFIAAAGFNDHRTAAGFAAAARALNAKTRRTLTVFGAGKIAAPSIRYIAEVCPIERVNIIARRPGRATMLADAISDAPYMKNVEVRVPISAEEATREADVIVTVTTSDTPVVFGRWVKPGALVILGGANRPHAREADDDLITHATIFVDHIEGCIEKAGDIRLPVQAGLFTRANIAGEIGAILSGHLKYEETSDKVVVFKSIGLIVQDMVLAEALLERAGQTGTGAFYDIQEGSIRQAREAVLA